jgi:hypothetical protein
MKKRILSILIAAAVVLSSCQSTENETSTQTAETSTTAQTPAASTTDVMTTAEIPQKTTAETTAAADDFVLTLPEEPIYFDVQLAERESGSGMPMSYLQLYNEEEILFADKLQNYLKYEILDVYTMEEAFEITGDDDFLRRRTLFKARIIYDYLNQTALNIEIRISFNGTATWQYETWPLPLAGDVYISPLLFLEEYLTSKHPYCALNTAMMYADYVINGAELAYRLNDKKYLPGNADYPDLYLNMTDGEKKFITSTSNNPVYYTQKATAEALGSFIREDWTKREFPFFDLKAHDGFRFEDFDFLSVTVYEEAVPTPVQIKSEDYPLDIPYDPIYFDVKFSEIIGDGSPQSYDELDEWLLIYDTVNFVQYEILDVYTPEEAIQLTGDDIFADGTTMYRIKITHDYLSHESLNIEVFLAKAGTPELQLKGSPMYKAGEVYMSPIKNLEAVLKGETAWCVGMAELTYAYYEVDYKDHSFDMSMAYHIGAENIRLIAPDGLMNDFPLLEHEKQVVTTTENNPVCYTQKIFAPEVGELIREDWTAKGFNFLDLKAYDGFHILTELKEY